MYCLSSFDINCPSRNHIHVSKEDWQSAVNVSSVPNRVHLVPEWFHLGFKISWKFLSHGCTCLHDKVMAHLKPLWPSIRSPEWWVSWCDYDLGLLLEHLCLHYQLKVTLLQRPLQYLIIYFFGVGELSSMSVLFLSSSPLCFLHSFMEPILNILPCNTEVSCSWPHPVQSVTFCFCQYIWCILPPSFMNKTNCCVNASECVVDYPLCSFAGVSVILYT